MLCNSKALVSWSALPVLFLLVPSLAIAQLEPPSTGGFVALAQELRMLGHHQRVLLIAAHPDDEDTELLTLLVRGMGAEAAYLSLNRGEGGQNLIGDELGEELGLLRTEELLAARRLDGARQFFTRAYDFGFSKSLDDTWAHWPRDSVLKDVVRIVRRFRPQIVVSVFSGTARDGHGQHQAAGWAAREAFRIAGDSTRFPELLGEEGLPAWTALKLYRSTRFDTAATTLRLDGGELDPAVGQSYHQIAMRGRSLHRSQDMGQLQRIGPSVVRLELLQDRTERGGNDLWAGVDTTLAGLWMGRDPAQRPAFEELTRRAAALLDSARQVGVQSPRLLPLLLRADSLLFACAGYWRGGIGRADDPLGDQLLRMANLLRRAAGVIVEAVVEPRRPVPGEPVTVTVSAWNAGRDTLTLQRMSVGWPFTERNADEPVVRVPPGEVTRWTASGPVSVGPEATVPYFLRAPRDGDLYRWPPAGSGWNGLPVQPVRTAGFQLFLRPGMEGWSYIADAELAWRINDQARGEVRGPVVVVPRVDVKLDPASDVWRAGLAGARQFSVTLTHGASDTTSGTVTLELPEGWSMVAPQRFRLTTAGERRTFRFTVRPPVARRGQVEIRAVATDSRGARYDLGVFTIDYPHIQPRSYTRPAVAKVTIAPLALPALARVGYVRGAADRIPEALQSVGLPVELLTGLQLANRPLARYDVIVIGPRAWETDADLPAANERLLAFARRGGTVIVQYQQYGYFLGDYAPYPLTVGSRRPGAADSTATVTSRTSPQAGVGTALLSGHDRVTDEAAPVSVVDPRSPVVLRPNRLGPHDWEGWVQERGLYFARSWDPAWKQVLEMHDPGESPLEGGLLLSRVGKGTYVYTGLAFFRQLPAGVPGAFRLFANLLALGRGVAR